MSKTIYFLSAALIGIAPKLGAQAAGGTAQVTIPPAVLERVLSAKNEPKGRAVKKERKGPGAFHLSASQRAPDPSTLVVVTGPNGERRLVRAKKRTK